MRGGGNLIENKITATIGRLDKVTYTAEFPVVSDLSIYYPNTDNCREADKPAIISIGQTSASAYAKVDCNLILRIEPQQDSTYIYTY